MKYQRDILLDLSKYLIGKSTNDIIKAFVNREREEAIKWIKADETKDVHKDPNIIVKGCNQGHRCDTCTWLKNFFNITEEDLE